MPGRPCVPPRRLIRVPRSARGRRGFLAGFRNVRRRQRRAGTGRHGPSSARCPPAAKRLGSALRSWPAGASCADLPCVAHRRVIALYLTSFPCLMWRGRRQGGVPTPAPTASRDPLGKSGRRRPGPCRQFAPIQDEGAAAALRAGERLCSLEYLNKEIVLFFWERVHQPRFGIMIGARYSREQR